MENNEYIDDSTPVVESQEAVTDTEQVEEQKDSQEETKDWKAEALKYKAIAERKDKKLQQQEETPKVNKPNTEQAALTREEAILFAKGASEEDVELAKKVSKINETGLLEAFEDDYVQASIKKRQAEAQAKANQLPPSGGSAPANQRQKSPGKMTREEHMEWTKKKMQG